MNIQNKVQQPKEFYAKIFLVLGTTSEYLPFISWHTLTLGLLPELVLSYQVFNLFYFTLWAKPYNLHWHYPNLQSYRLKGCQVVITLLHIRQGNMYGPYTFSLFFHALARTGNRNAVGGPGVHFPYQLFGFESL